jgi:hypothetical protein
LPSFKQTHKAVTHDATIASLEQDVDNTPTIIQDSSAESNILSNENEFGDDIAVIDQENIAEQNAANVGVQE